MYLCCFYVKYLHLAYYFNKSEYYRPLPKQKKKLQQKQFLHCKDGTKAASEMAIIFLCYSKVVYVFIQQLHNLNSLYKCKW